MTLSASIYKRMSIERLQRLSATEGDHQNEAARVYVNRLADMELERRLCMRHQQPGWHQCSPGFGDGTGASTVAREPLAEAYDRGEIVNSYWHCRASAAIDKLPQRHAAALMICTAKTDHRTNGPFSATHDQIAANIGHYLQLLGWAPGVKVLGWYKQGQAIKRSAWQARIELLLQAKVGVL